MPQNIFGTDGVRGVANADLIVVIYEWIQARN